ncbi:MAG: hypothetical protein AB7O80_21885 [Acetobacteraceae bacterium]
MTRWTIVTAACLALLAASVGGAAAQAVTEAQADAIRAACRSDFLRNCMGVPRGGKEALACLQQHDGQLSQGCRQAVSAVPPAKP